MLRQQFKTFRHFERPRVGAVKSLEDRLNELTEEGYTIFNVSVTKDVFVKDGSNHGHGGNYELDAFIVAYKMVGEEEWNDR